MLACGSLARWATTKTSASNLPQLARFLSNTLCAHRASDLPAARAISRAYVSALNARRSYATTTAAATKPTATVKKAVKAQAKSSARPKRAAASKATSKTAKKPAKKATATKTKAKAKPKAKPKAKKAAPKKAGRKKKVLTPEDKQKAQIRELRKAALREPVSATALSAYNVFIGEFMKKKQPDETAAAAIKEASRRYKELTPAEREHYNHLTNEQNAARQAEYTAWINTYTPAQIHAANNARLMLRRKAPTRKTAGHAAHTAPLKDDRQVKRPASAYIVFNVERWASGDMKGIAAPDAAKMIGQEWKALSAGEKKKYEDAFAADMARYRREAAGAY